MNTWHTTQVVPESTKQESKQECYLDSKQHLFLGLEQTDILEYHKES